MQALQVGRKSVSADAVRRLCLSDNPDVILTVQINMKPHANLLELR